MTNGGPVGRFLAFIPFKAHGAEYLTNVIIKFLSDNDIPISDCRGESYDSAANMSGQYAGLQAKFKEFNKYAEYIPCAGHSLNLVGVKAVECNTQVVRFFNLIERLYIFFQPLRIGGNN